MFYMKIIYFDNAATSHYKPRCVIKAFLKAVRTSANPGRSGHKLSLKNANIVYKTREIRPNTISVMLMENEEAILHARRIIIISIIIGFISGLAPSIIAGRKNIIETLRNY